MKLLLKVDIDGVLRDWNHSLIRVFKRHHPDAIINYPFRDFKIDPDFPAGTDTKTFYSKTEPEDIYLNAEPYAGAIEFIEFLVREFPYVWLVTTQFPTTMYPTMAWVEKHIPSHRDLPLVFSREKGLIGRGKFDQTLLIDDAPHNLLNENEAGGIPVCFGQSYNYGKANFAVGFYGEYTEGQARFTDVNFSEEHEAERVTEQFLKLKQWLLEMRECGYAE